MGLQRARQYGSGNIWLSPGSLRQVILKYSYYLILICLLGAISFLVTRGRWQYAAVLIVLPWVYVSFINPQLIGVAALAWPVVVSLHSPRYSTVYPPLSRFLPGVLWGYMDELLCYGFFTLVLVQRMRLKQSLRLKWFIWVIIVFSMFALLSALYNHVDRRQALLITSTYLKPWFIFCAAANLPDSRRFALRIWKGMVGYGMLNIFIVLLQYRHSGIIGDSLFGITRNCNAMAVIMFDVALVLLIDFLLRHDLKKLVASFVFMVTGVMGSWMVATFSFLLTMVIAIFLTSRRRMHYLAQRIVLGIVLLALGIGIISRLDNKFINISLDRLTRGTRTGMVQAYPILLRAVLNRPLNLFLGFGQGAYGSSYAQSLAFKGGGTEHAYLLAASKRISVDRLTNSITGLAGDFGVVACAMIIASMILLFWKGIRAYKLRLQERNHPITQDIVLLVGFGLVMLFHLAISSLYPWQTLDDPFLMFPQLAILGGLMGRWSKYI